MKMTLRITGRDEIAKKLKATPAQVRRASRKTVRQVVNEGYRELGGTIPRTAGIPVGGYRRVRAKKQTPKGRQRSSRGEVWMGTNKIAAKFAGKVRNDPTTGGAWAGKYFFENSFVAKMRNGYESIFERVHGSRKLQQRYVHLPDARNDAQRSADRMELRLRKILRANLEKELAKAK